MHSAGQSGPCPARHDLDASQAITAALFITLWPTTAFAGQQLRAAAEALLPASSSEEESSSEAETQDGRRELQGSDQQQQRDARDPGRHRRREKGEEDGERRQKRKKEQKRKRKRRGRSRSQEPGGKRRREGGEAQGLPNDWQQAVEMERRKGPQARASQVSSRAGRHLGSATGSACAPTNQRWAKGGGCGGLRGGGGGGEGVQSRGVNQQSPGRPAGSHCWLQVRGWAGREVLKEPYYYDTRWVPSPPGLALGRQPGTCAVRPGPGPRPSPQPTLVSASLLLRGLLKCNQCANSRSLFVRVHRVG